jgi:hypothetical protein
MPDALALSDDAVNLLQHLLATQDTRVTADNLEAYRELVRAGIMFPLSGMVGGPESRFLFTENGWNRRDEWTARPDGSS